MKKLKGFIVSDGQEKPEKYKGRPIFTLSEISIDDNVGIIICLGNSNRKVVEKLLIQKGITRYIAIGD